MQRATLMNAPRRCTRWPNRLCSPSASSRDGKATGPPLCARCSGCSTSRPPSPSGAIPGGGTTWSRPETSTSSSRNCGGRSSQGPPHDKDTEETKDTKDDLVLLRVRGCFFLFVLDCLCVLSSLCVLVAT